MLFSLVFGVWRLLEGDTFGWLSIIAAVLLVVGHFRYGTVWLAFKLAQLGRLESAKKLLLQVKRPQYLSIESRTYYNFLFGAILKDEAKNAEAEVHLRSALAGRLRTNNDVASAQLTLAETLCALGREPGEVHHLIGLARSMAPDDRYAARIKVLQERVKALD